jgi:hypothetical protein
LQQQQALATAAAAAAAGINNSSSSFEKNTWPALPAGTADAAATAAVSNGTY